MASLRPLSASLAARARQIRTAIRVSELVTIRPPTMLTIRSAWSITRWSCVTSRTVVRSGPSAMLAEQVEDGLARLGVERGGRLVGEDQRRLVDQGPGDRHPLLLAAGELRPAGG